MGRFGDGDEDGDGDGNEDGDGDGGGDGDQHKNIKSNRIRYCNRLPTST